MYITGMTVKDLPPISERIIIRCDPRVNVLIGAKRCREEHDFDVDAI